MLATIQSCAVVGLDGYIVQVEVDISPGLPAFNIVGLPDAAVQEARERVRAAVRNTGCVFPMRRITVNLAPADLRKAGPAYDLPIALGILLSSEQVEPPQEGAILLGSYPWTAVSATPGAFWPWCRWPGTWATPRYTCPVWMHPRPPWWRASMYFRSPPWPL